MFIKEYEYKDGIDNGWEIESTTFNKINLCVGESGVGKTRLLNTLVNLCAHLLENVMHENGHWTIIFNITNSEDTYFWELKINDRKIVKEVIKCDEEILVVRDSIEFKYLNKKLPQLDNQQSAIKLLANEPTFNLIIEDFRKIIRRNFFNGELEGQSLTANFDDNAFLNDSNHKIHNGLLRQNVNFPIVMRLFLISQKAPKKWNKVKDLFLEVFPHFDEVFFIINGNGKQLAIKEKDEVIPLHELSTGYQKALLLLSDLVTLQKGSVYLLDEIENSLGSNILDIIPEYFYEYSKNIQFIITSHHPYIINSISYTKWRILKRKNKIVSIIKGEDFADDFKLSKHDAYIKLRNMV